MYDIATIRRLNRRVEKLVDFKQVTNDEIEEIIYLYGDTAISQPSWVEQKILSLALEIKWLRATKK